ncbi:MAG: FG-GAP-like repeat-containing protein [Planctomycetota bacterium]|jgi:hypothetical protein
MATGLHVLWCAAWLSAAQPGDVLPCGEPLFPARQFDLPQDPRGVAAADFDHDGNADLAVAHLSSFSILQGGGDGTFGDPVETPMATIPAGGRPLASADLNGDGNADLAIAVSTGYVVVLLGDGAGSFSTGRYPAGPLPSSIAIDDLDDDGDPDIAVVSLFEGSVGILLNQGDGTFIGLTAAPPVVSPRFIAIAEFNGDRNADLAVASTAADAVSILLGHGDGTFDPPLMLETADGPVMVVAGDLDGDGDDDLAVAGAEPAIFVHLGDGSGGFAPPATYGAGSLAKFLAGVDLDDDGDVDLVEISEECVMFGVQHCVGVLENQGDATFSAAVSHAVGQGPAAAVIMDLTGDGHADLAVARDGEVFSGPSLTVLRGRGDATFETAVIPDLVTSYNLTVADLDQDGNVDLASSNWAVVVRLGNGDGTFTAATSYPGGMGAGYVAVADINGDGILDLGVSSENLNHGIFLLYGTGDGSFQVWGSPFTYGEGRDVALADFDGDSDVDLAMTSLGPFPPHLSLFFNDGTGNWSYTPAVEYQIGDCPAEMAEGDLDGDGDVDLAIIDICNAELWLVFNDGDGGFSPTSQFELVSGFNYDLTLGDLDLDGWLDVVATVLVGDEPQLAVLLSQGGGVLADPVFISAGSGGTVAIGDVDRDGLPDLVTGALSILRGTGEGAFGPPSTFAGFVGRAVGLLDVDHDGDVDVASNHARLNLFVNNMCPLGDLDGDGAVAVVDFLLLLAAWGPCPDPCPPRCDADLDGDCAVGVGDFLTLLAHWG